MWLLDTITLCLTQITLGPSLIPVPYAILSHVWGDEEEEVSFYEVQEQTPAAKQKAGWKKMINFCNKARELGFGYVWIDTCCIDKRSSADLSEDINSMYTYYRKSLACFIYLEDVPPFPSTDNETQQATISRTQQLEAVQKTKWASRGWTLQEFIAPKRRCFFASDWSLIHNGPDLVEALFTATGIHRGAIIDTDTIQCFSIAERMSWAAKRITTRPEDMAYSLMGLFGVSMPILYGEGGRKAFKGLQSEIIQMAPDMSIFAWRGDYEGSGLLARSPVDFANSPRLSFRNSKGLSPFSMTNVGLSIRLNIIQFKLASPFKEMPEFRDNDSLDLLFLAALRCADGSEREQPRNIVVYLARCKDVDFFINNKLCPVYRRFGHS
ncbi:HET-domain-containing protein [Biscogniauxia mediterranea]|nr:HET-domain-containing protein [Biscogniauxia mediterranea]